MWLRLLLGFVCPVDLYLLWTKGKTFSSDVHPYTQAIALLAALICVVAYASHPDGEVPSQFACWYRYGDGQVVFDLVLLVLLVCCKGYVLAFLNCHEPLPLELKAEREGDRQREEGSATGQGEDGTMNPMSMEMTLTQRDVSIDTGKIEILADDVEKGEGDVEGGRLGEGKSVEGGVVDEGTKEGEAGQHHMKGEMKASKCGITGNYVYRMKMLVAFSLASTIFQILANVTQLPSSRSSAEGPIFNLVQILNIIGYDGVGMIMYLLFHNMRATGWVKSHAFLRQFVRNLKILNLVEGEGRQEGVAVVSTTWKRLANKLAESDVIGSHMDSHNIKHEKCVAGNALLTYMVKVNLAANREAAKGLLCTLFDHDLLHHISYEFGASDLDSEELFAFVTTTQSMIEKQERDGADINQQVVNGDHSAHEALVI